jgi:putative ABC transport system substrate-binding protein
MTRREFIWLALGTCAWPRVALAQGRGSPFRIALLGSGAEGAASSVNELKWLVEGLGDEGLFEGRDFMIERRYAGGDYARFGDLARELLTREPGAIVVSTIAAARAAQQLTKAVPIVMLGLNDPIGVGLVPSLASPGGNITGLATMNEDLQLKIFQMLREALPSARTVMALMNPSNPSNTGMLAAIRGEAAINAMSIATVEASAPRDLDRAFNEVERQRPDVLLVLPDISLVALSPDIMRRAAALRLPVVGTAHELTEAGALLSYGRVRRDTIRRAANYLKRLSGGAKAADLPIEQPTRFMLTVNARQARALNLNLSASLLAAADEVIE